MNRDPQQAAMFTVRLVAFALVAGQVLFGAVVAFLLYGTDAGAGLGGSELGILGPVAAGAAVLIVPVAFLVRGARFSRVAELDGPERLNAYTQAVIVFFAMLEGVGLFNLVAWMVTGDLVPAVPVVVLLLAIALASFPSEAQLNGLGDR